MEKRPMKVRAMFYCEAVTPHQGNSLAVNVRLSAAFGTYLTNKGLPEADANTEWAKYTPNGQLTMTIDNPTASNQFEIGEVYELQIEKVSK
jgi:hypothetical protein